MKFKIFCPYLLVWVLFIGLAFSAHGQSLDEAISGVAEEMLQHYSLPRDSRVAFGDFNASSQNLEREIVSQLEERLQEQFTLITIDEQDLDLFRQEFARADAEEVAFASQQRSGKWEGVQCFITGSISLLGDSYLLQIRVYWTERRAYRVFQRRVNKNDPKLLSLLEKKPLHFSAGLRVGLPIQLWTLSNDIIGSAENPAISFEPAIQGAFHFTDLIAVQAEIALSLDTVSYSGTEGITAFTASFESLSLRIPVLARFTFRPFISLPSFSLSPFVGISFNIPLGDLKTKSSNNDNSSYQFSMPLGYVIGVSAGMRLFEGKPLEGLLFLDIRFSGDIGKTGIKDSAGGMLSLYTRNTISITLGYEFDFFLNR